MVSANDTKQKLSSKRFKLENRTIDINDFLFIEKRAVTADIARRLVHIFGNGPELWLNLQKAVDLLDAEQANRPMYAKIKPRQTT